MEEVMMLYKTEVKRDFLKIAHFSRSKRGLKPIKSATAVYNRGRSCNIQSIQATHHLGLALFCTKKQQNYKIKSGF